MSKETKNPSKRDQALNDASEGQFGKEPKAKPNPNIEDEPENKRQEAVERQKKVAK